MFRADACRSDAPTFAELSYRELDGWTVIPGSVALTFVTVGDDVTGPLLTLLVSLGDAEAGPAHSHATDSLRLCLRGEQGYGRVAYGAGDFRFQRGWVPYTNERLGPEGSWALILGADRRGSRARMTDPALAGSELDLLVRRATKDLTVACGVVADDWLSDHPADTAGPSALAATLGPIAGGGKLDGSFADASSWDEVGPGSRAAVALAGDPDSGPVLVLVATAAGATAAPRCRFDTEVLRLVVGGGATIGERTYAAGDLRVDRAGAWCDPVLAGPDGLQELVVVADRRRATPVLEDGGPVGWPVDLPATVARLAGHLVPAEPAKPGPGRLGVGLPG